MSTAGLPTTVPSYGALEDDAHKTERMAREIEVIGGYIKTYATKGVIPLPLGSFTKVDGTPLAVYSAANDGTCGLYGDGTKALGIRWNNTAGTTDTIATTFKVPSDCLLTTAPVIKIKCAKVGATAADLTTFVVGMYAQTEGALYDAGSNLGATSGAVANSATKTVQLVSATLTVFPAVASGMTLTINPTAALLATDDMIVFDAWIEYTRAVTA